ncbi:transposase [Neobacillus sp. YIM B02564]|uniref:Transposase n=1 Tax=Neobacillus paridis TaxID=2803862 RepID=A0ABS1TK58_9BACI|nr:helix-turn-helix domain-containing protein [Neobacillus paridis]MBL4951677.1 transposase [Neobacillus paridis]
MKNRYKTNFKKAIVELYTMGRSVSYLSKEYSVPKSTIYNWLHEKQPEVLKINITIVRFSEFKVLI